MNNKLSAVLALSSIAALAACGGGGYQISDKGRGFRDGSMAQKIVDAGDAVSQMMTAETNIGREAAASLVARYGLSDDAKMQRYVRLVGATVARKAKRKDVKWRFAVLDSREPNAFAAPGGYIFVTRGLVKLLDDESQLAGALAHEVVHVDEKQAMKALNLAATATAASKILTDRAEFRMAADKVIKLVDHGYGRNNEIAADKGGTVILEKAGYDTSGLIRALEKIAAAKGDREDSFSSRHPGTSDRVKAIESLGLPQKGLSLQKRFKSTLGA